MYILYMCVCGFMSHSVSVSTLNDTPVSFNGTVTMNSLLCFYCTHTHTLPLDALFCGWICRRVCVCLTHPQAPLSVCVSVSVRYAPSQRWHIDTILHVLTTVNTERATHPAASYMGFSLTTLLLSFILPLLMHYALV